MQMYWLKLVNFKKLEQILLNSTSSKVPLTYTNVSLLVLLQLCLWGVGIYNVWLNEEDLIREHNKSQKSLTIQNRLQAGNYFPDALKALPWLSWEWQKNTCGALSNWEATSAMNSTKALIPQQTSLEFCLLLKGTASAKQWQTALVQLDEFAPFRPMNVHWEKTNLGEWQAELGLRPVSKKANRQAYSLFPFSGFSRVQLQHQVQLVGTVYLEEEFRGLLEVNDTTLSVLQGDWLPELLASVVFIDSKKIVLRYLDGNESEVFLNKLSLFQ